MAKLGTHALLLAAAVVLVPLGLVLPTWLVFLVTIGLAKGLVVIGLVVMMRAGLVSFGQGLYYGLGAYSAGLAANFLGLNDAVLLLVIGAAVGIVVALGLGVLLVRYRQIFFAMLSLAVSMILYGALVRSTALGSTDGFNLPPPTFLGLAPDVETGRRILFVLALLLALGTASLLHRFTRSPTGVLGEAIVMNEIRVEYLGASVSRVLLITYVIGAITAALGGVLVALATSHIDPDLAFWTTSGEFVFVAILSGTGHVAASLVGMVLFETVRSFAFQYSPYTWQMVVGTAMLLVIVFLPYGLWSLVSRGEGRSARP
ncbi:MAG: branched-chain amino acid ABC transporter permease [Proteobacteria bacterium]|nr:MAG: branched-chain amino acid ABC transporter permease [Pseudomonadota bacterium]